MREREGASDRHILTERESEKEREREGGREGKRRERERSNTTHTLFL